MAIYNNTQNIKSLLVNGQELADQLAALKTRQDSLATALSSAAGDYETEIIDARVDAFGNGHANIGNNIRDTQSYIMNYFKEKISLQDSQIDILSDAVITLAELVTKFIGKENANS